MSWLGPVAKKSLEVLGQGLENFKKDYDQQQDQERQEEAALAQTQYLDGKFSQAALNAQRTHAEVVELSHELPPYIAQIKSAITELERNFATRLSLAPALPSSVETFLRTQGVALSDIQTILQNPPVNRLLTEQLVTLQNIDTRLQQAQTQAATLARLNEGEAVFNQLTAIGIQHGSPVLAHIGGMGVVAMQAAKMLSAAELAGGIGNISVLGPMGVALSATMWIMNMFFSEDRDSGLQGLSQQIVALNQVINTHMQNMHLRFDRVEGRLTAIQHGMHQIQQNQQAMLSLQKDTYRLIQCCFQRITEKLHNMQNENRFSHERIISALRHLAYVGELDKLKNTKVELTEKYNAARVLAKKRHVTDSDRTAAIVLLSELHTAVINIASIASNGLREYQHIMHDPEQSFQYLHTHIHTKEWALVPLALEYEALMRPLSEEGIDKTLLFSHSLWGSAAHAILQLSVLPALRDYPERDIAYQKIRTHAKNAIKFMQEIGQNVALWKKLLSQHAEHCHAFQLSLAQHTAAVSERGNLGAAYTLQEYYAEGAPQTTMQALARTIDKSYLLIQQFAELGGLSEADRETLAALSQSKTLLTQSFDFTLPQSNLFHMNHFEQQLYARGGRAQHCSIGCETIGGDIVQIQEMQDGNLVEKNKILHFMLSHNDTSESMIDITLCDLETEAESRHLFWSNQAANVIPPTYSQVTAQRRFDANIDDSQAWSFTGVHQSRFWVLQVAGYVTMLDPQTKEWLSCNHDNMPSVVLVPKELRQHGGRNTDSTYATLMNDTCLLTNRFNWSDKNNVVVDFFAFDLSERRWLVTHEKEWLPTRPLDIPKTALPAPNQVCCQSLQDNTWFSLFTLSVQNGHACVGRYVKGLTGANNREWSIDQPMHHDDIAIKSVSQVTAEKVKIQGKESIVIVASAKMRVGNKLVFFMQDTRAIINDPNSRMESCEYILPKIHATPDLQAMQLKPVTMGGRDYLLVTLLNPEYRQLVFCFDPHNKKVTAFAPGPVIFPEWQEKPDDLHVGQRQQQPGFYPLGLSTRVIYKADTIELHTAVAKRKDNGQPNWCVSQEYYLIAPLIKAHFDAYNIVITPATTPSTQANYIEDFRLLADTRETELRSLGVLPEQEERVEEAEEEQKEAPPRSSAITPLHDIRRRASARATPNRHSSSSASASSGQDARTPSLKLW